MRRSSSSLNLTQSPAFADLNPSYCLATIHNQHRAQIFHRVESLHDFLLGRAQPVADQVQLLNVNRILPFAILIAGPEIKLVLWDFRGAEIDERMVRNPR